MKSSDYVSIPKLFDEVQMYLSNTGQQPDVQKRLSLNGLNQKMFLEGHALLDNAKGLYVQQNEKYGEKKETARQIQYHEQLARHTFEEHVAIVKFVFRKEPVTLAKFNVERIEKKIEVWSLQASMFYSVANSYADVLAQQGLTQEELAQATAMVEAVSNVRHQRLVRKGQAEEATRLRDDAIKALRAWAVNFRAIARLALKNSPQLMETLGIIVKSKKV